MTEVGVKVGWVTHLSSHEAAVLLNPVIQSRKHCHGGVVAQHSKGPQDDRNLGCRQLLRVPACLHDLKALYR